MNRILTLLALGGCAHGLGHPRVEYAASPSDATALPIVHIAADPLRWYLVVDTHAFGLRLFYLDTGYADSTCDDDFAHELGLPIFGRTVVQGVAGSVPSRLAVLPPFDIGGQHIASLTCVVRDLDSTSSIADSPEVRVAGVLGADVLRRFTVEIDPSRGVALLEKPENAPALVAGADGVVRMKPEFGTGDRFRVPLEVENHRVWPIVDTGAALTLLDGRRLGLSQAHERVAVQASGGPDTTLVGLRAYYVELVHLGGAPVGPVLITGQPQTPSDPGLLGLDVLVDFDQTYDFARGLARFTPIARAAIPSWHDWALTHGTAMSCGLDPSCVPRK